MQYNLGVERAVGADSVVSVNYVGSGSRRLPLGGFYNTALTPGPGNAALRRPFPVHYADQFRPQLGPRELQRAAGAISPAIRARLDAAGELYVVEIDRHRM